MLPVMHYRNPMSIYFDQSFEPQYAKNSITYLHDYHPDKIGLKKAKSYWLNLDKYSADPVSREKIWDDYPNEVRSIRSLVGIIHKKICNDAVINRGYYRQPRDPGSDPVPSSFVRLEDYTVVEPNDVMTTIEVEALGYFLHHAPCDKIWNINRDNLNQIQDRFPHKIEALKILLWQRHIALQEHRKTISDHFNLQTLTAIKSQKPWVITITTISFVAGVIFCGIAIACAQPLLLIPAIISAVISVLTPSIYIYRRIFYAA